MRWSIKDDNALYFFKVNNGGDTRSYLLHNRLRRIYTPIYITLMISYYFLLILLTIIYTINYGK